MNIKCILDTNILIQLEEPGVDGRFKDGFTELAHFCHKHGVRIFYHPASKTEIENDPNTQRRSKTLEWLKKYPPLEHVPTAEKNTLEEMFGGASSSNDLVDFQILYALKRNCADYLISQDDRLRSRSSRGSLGNRTYSILEFLTFLRRLYEPEKVFIPNVEETRTYSIDRKDPIYDSLRQSYGPVDFEKWLDKCDKEDRVTWVIKDGSSIAALVVVKPENPEDEGIPELTGRTLKVCTFKVADGYRGGKVGELLLKQVFTHSIKNKFDSTYMTFFAEQEYLSLFLKDFGFQISSAMTKMGEFIYFKTFSRPNSEESKIHPKDFHIKYSPWHYCAENIQKFIVPIIPKYHEVLFPELYTQQLKLPFAPTGTIPGNTLKKVYLSNSPRLSLASGSLLFFYCSKDQKAITTIGVVEESIKTTDLNECLRFIGKRSVYQLSDIEGMTAKEVLIIDFRLAYHLEKPVSYEFLLQNQIIKGPTISITEVSSSFDKLKPSLSPFYGV